MKIKILLLSIISAFLYGCIAFQPITYPESGSKHESVDYSYVTIVSYVEDTSLPEITRFHDNKAEVTCWIARNDIKTSISCIPDYELPSSLWEQ